jgi:asparagine synthase (glutamine-hydrolysing)
LSGEGADELFAGYVGYRFDQARASRPSRLQHDDPAERALRAELWGDADLRYEYDYVAHGKIRKSLYAPELRERLEDFDCLKQPIIKHDRIRGRHRLNQRSYLDFKLRMGDHLLIDHGDCMALANSVEVRYPFLDLDLIELSKTIPPDLKLRNFQEKYILRKIAEPALPSMITRREKFGWFAPGSPEMLQQKVEWINDVLDEESIRRDGYFDVDAVSALRKRYSEPGFKLNYPFENDWLIVIATFGVFKRIFDMPDL